MKKTLSLILVILICLSVNVTSFAYDFFDDAKNDFICTNGELYLTAETKAGEIDYFGERFTIADKDGNLLSVEGIKTLVKHPTYAVENSSKYFILSDLEKDIIATHMFPISFKIPKYLESWIVDLVDDGISIYERLFGIRKQLSFATSFMFILFMNRFK